MTDALGASGDSAVRQQVRGEIGRLRSLADRLLDFARPRELRPTRLMAGELVSISVELVEDYAREHEVRVEVVDEDPEEPLSVEGDLLLSVFTNLLRNAVEAVSGLPDERRRVSLHARVEGRSWIVSVEDAGAGLAPELRGRVYEPFTSGRRGGVGLGLAVARRFVELHGGELELASGALGGACFRVILPLGEPAEATPNRKPGEA